jgi:hypothetical protein
MNQDELKRTFKEATASPPRGSRERVWRALDAPPAPRRSLMLIPVFAAAVLVGVSVTALVLRPSSTDQRWNDSNAVVVWRAAHASLDVQNRQVTVKSGEVALSSWGGPPLELRAAGHTVRVESGVAVVLVAGASVTVSPIDGAVWFDGTSMHANAASRTAAGELGREVLELESAVARPRRMLARADESVAEKNFDAAVATLSAVAELGTLDAEVALYKKGELQLRQLGRPEAALDTFDDGEARFVDGALTQERRLSALEACVKLSRWSAVVSRADAFLARHSDSERVDEVRLLHAGALAQLGDLKGACAEVAGLPAGLGAALRARCAGL